MPTGDTVLQAGDRLTVIGGPEDIDVLKARAAGAARHQSTPSDR
jgi:Trk K+ transport system NAD-binding subunit